MPRVLLVAISRSRMSYGSMYSLLDAYVRSFGDLQRAVVVWVYVFIFGRIYAQIWRLCNEELYRSMDSFLDAYMRFATSSLYPPAF